MKTKRTINRVLGVLFSVSFLLTGNLSNAQDPLNGTYTIGTGGTPGYETIGKATDSLETNGVDGPVIMNIKTGNYNERVSLYDIPGVSDVNTVTFQSEAQHVDSVMIFEAGASGDEWVFGLFGCDYVTLQFLTIYNSGNTYARGVRLDHTSQYNTITECKLIGASGSPTSSNQALISFRDDDVTGLEISHNEFLNGSYSVHLYGYYTTSTEVKINHNISNSYRGMYLDRLDAVEVIGNEINCNNGDALQLQECANTITVTYNRITTNYSGGHNGIYLSYSDGSFAFMGLVANNTIELNGTWDYRCNGIYAYYSDYQRIFHNTVSVNQTGTDGSALSANYGTGIEAQNNMLICSGGYVVRDENGTSGPNFATLDYNNYYTSGNFIAIWEGSNINDLDALRTASGKDANSTFIYPLFISSTDSLVPTTPWLENTGTNLSATISDDVNGIARSTTPDVGAHEYSVPAGTPYNGSLTINHAGGGDFTNFSDAIDSLLRRGVDGPVTFTVATGTYNEQLYIRPFPGVNETNTILFTSATGDSTDVTIEIESASSNNYTVYMHNADYITMEKMTLSNTGASYGIVYRMSGNAHHNTLQNCVLSGSGNAADTYDRSVVYSNASQVDNTTIKNNRIVNGSHGIRLSGVDVDHARYITIQNNQLSGHYNGIRINYATDFDVLDNEVTDFTNSGIYAYYCLSPSTVAGNTLSSSDCQYRGIDIYRCDGSGEGALYYNNFIHINNNNYVFGIHVYRSDYQSFYHNSVNVVSTHANSRAFSYDWYDANETDLILMNNILAVVGPGHPIYVDNINPITSDYNNLFTTGANIAFVYPNEYNTLEGFTSATGNDANSLNFNPNFLSESDLHTDSYWLDSAATPIAQVTLDIDGEPRDATYPDIGADEYSSGSIPLAGEYTIGDGGNYASINEAVDDLVLKGMLDSVVFNILPDNYGEQVEIPQIDGSNENRRLYFQSSTGNPDDVIITYEASGASDNYVFLLNGTDNVTIQNLSLNTGGSAYAKIIVLGGNALNNEIINNKFQGRSTSSTELYDAIISTDTEGYTSDNDPYINNTLIQGNTFSNGSYGVCLQHNDAAYGTNLQIKDNTINTYYMGIYVQFFSAPEIASNYITYTVNNGYGIDLNNCSSGASSGLKIYNNQIYTNASNDYGSLYLRYCDASVSYPGLIYNNVIRAGEKAKDRHIGIHINESDYIQLYHNTVNISGDEFDDFAFYAYRSENLTLKNNNFAVNGSSAQNYSANGYAVYITEGSVAASDYNNFYTSGRYVAKWVDSWYRELENLQAATTMDQNSVCVYPAFPGENDLHTNSSWLDNEGYYMSGFATDIEGNARNETAPSIGAYEFVSDQTPIDGGAYTVGTGGNFPTVDSLETALMELGISGQVTFNFKTDNYPNTNMFLKQIPGASELSTVVLQSETGEPENVAWTYSQTASSNYMIHLNGTDYITIMNMKFTASGDGYANIIAMNGFAHDVNIIGNSFNGPTKNSDDGDMSCIWTQYECFYDNILIQGNSFNNNSYGIQINGKDNINNTNIVVQNNELSGQHRALYFYYILGPVIQNNTIEGFSNAGVYLYYCDEDIQIVGNKITTEYDNIDCIYLYYCDGTVADQGLIANNFIRGDGTGSNAYGINTYYSNYHRIYYNSVNITGSNYGGTACYLYNGGNFAVKNNIFAHKDGYAYYLSNAGIVSVSDYNNIYSEHTSRFARINYTDYASLDAFQVGSGLDPNSQDFEPLFISDDDLHLYNNDLMGKAAPIPDVVTDIDGEVRDGTTPDIGADELICESATLVVPDLEVCQFDVVNPQNNSTGYVNGTMFLWDYNSSLPYEDTTWTFDTVFSYSFLNAGNYSATLTAVQPGGCQDETTFSITVYAKPDEPLVEDTVIGCYGQDMPPLVAEGTDIRWYNNTDLAETHLLFTGDSLYSGDTELGNYTYYATQTINGCQSDYNESTLSIRETPEAPDADGATICFGDEIPTLTATGEFITWYSDEDLTDTLFVASEFTPEIDTAGTYYYYVTQNNGECESFPTEVILEVLPKPEIVETITNIDCQGTDFGTINLTIEDGTFPFYFAWSNGETSQDVTGLDVGEYFVIVTDANGCAAADTFNITEPPAIDLELITNDSECAESNGSATVTASGGVSPFEYHWSNGDTTTVNDSLSSGIYIVTVTDANGCEEVGVATINDLGAPEITVNAVQNVSCYGGADGQISLTVTAGAPPYEYFWSNGETTEDVSGLAAGPYEFQVVDTSGCLAVESFVITEPEPINIIMTTLESACGQSNGSAEATILGGTAPFSYEWSTGSTAESITGLDIGVYGLTVTDANACEASKLFTISEVGAPSVVVDSVVQGGCGTFDGAIYISVYGTAEYYQYLWSNGDTLQDLIGVNAGEYDVQVTDTATGCSSAAVAEIEYEQPEINPICMVSVDTASNYNEIIWEKEYTENVHHYNIYKESTQSDNYFLIGSVPVDEESIFVDSLSNSLVRSWRYKIAVVDSCGVESELSEHHKTMHLTVNLGVGGNVNLIWDHYEGFELSTYYIHRNVNNEGWELIDSVPDNLTSYTDLNPPEGSLWYFIELKHPYGCTIAKATNREETRSNLGNTSAETQSSANNFITYTFDVAIESTIDTDNHTVEVVVPVDTDVTSLTATFTASAGATVKIDNVTQVSGETANNFTNPVVYTIIAEDGTPQEWTVTVVFEGELSSENDFTEYLFTESITANINTDNHTVTSVVQSGTDVSNLVAIFTVSDGAIAYISGVEQESGITANDFTEDVTYTIIAEDGTAQDWVVSVSLEGELSSDNDFLTYVFAQSDGFSDINTANHQIVAPVSAGTDVTSLVAIFSVSDGATAYDNNGVEQISGETANDFTGLFIYNVIAEDGSEQMWFVDVVETSINQLAGNESYRIYPNPNSGLFTLEVTAADINEVTYFIYALDGQVVETSELQLTQNNRFEFDLSDMDSGMYYIKLVSDKGTFNHKIMIK